MRHEEVVKGHRKQYELAQLTRHELPTRIVGWRDRRIDRDQHAAVVRIAKRDRDAAADSIAPRVVEKIAAQRVVAEFASVPDKGNVAVIGLGDARVDLDITALAVELHPFAR